MFARTSTWSGSPEALQNWADNAVSTVKGFVEGLPGNTGAVFLVDRDSGTALTLTLWDSDSAARATDQFAEQSRAATVAATARSAQMGPHSGYWEADGQGLEPVDAADRAAALDVLAGGRPELFASAARTLLDQRDDALALEIITAGLAGHPESRELAELRQMALYLLMERYQLQDPFR